MGQSAICESMPGAPAVLAHFSRDSRLSFPAACLAAESVLAWAHFHALVAARKPSRVTPDAWTSTVNRHVRVRTVSPEWVRLGHDTKFGRASSSRTPFASMLILCADHAMFPTGTGHSLE